MKIICETEQEYNDLMTASKYIHDFTVWKDQKWEKDVTGLCVDQAVGNCMVGTICHLYCSNNPDLIVKGYEEDE